MAIVESDRDPNLIKNIPIAQETLMRMSFGPVLWLGGSSGKGTHVWEGTAT